MLQGIWNDTTLDFVMFNVYLNGLDHTQLTFHSQVIQFLVCRVLNSHNSFPCTEKVSFTLKSQLQIYRKKNMANSIRLCLYKGLKCIMLHQTC